MNKVIKKYICIGSLETASFDMFNKPMGWRDYDSVVNQLRTDKFFKSKFSNDEVKKILGKTSKDFPFIKTRAPNITF